MYMCTYIRKSEIIEIIFFVLRGAAEQDEYQVVTLF